MFIWSRGSSSGGHVRFDAQRMLRKGGRGLAERAHGCLNKFACEHCAIRKADPAASERCGFRALRSFGCEHVQTVPRGRAARRACLPRQERVPLGGRLLRVSKPVQPFKGGRRSSIHVNKFACEHASEGAGAGQSLTLSETKTHPVVRSEDVNMFECSHQRCELSFGAAGGVARP